MSNCRVYYDGEMLGQTSEIFADEGVKRTAHGEQVLGGKIGTRTCSFGCVGSILGWRGEDEMLNNY